MNRKVLETIKSCDMVRQGDRVYVALSGGADSVALLHLLCGLRSRLGCSVCALHLNHRLRGAESRRDELFVRRLCRRLQVPLAVGRAPVKKLAQKHGLSVEECARRVRYAFFYRHAAGENAKIATAHTCSDTVETILINLTRGTGLRGLCGIPPVRGKIVRPLIGCTRGEVERYCARHGLPYVTDSTNLRDDYTRNRIRHHVIPQLKRQNPRFEAQVADMAGMLRADADYLEQCAGEALKSLALAPGKWSRHAFLSLADSLRARVLKQILLAHTLPYDRYRLRLLEKTIRQGKGSVQISKNRLLQCDAAAFWITSPQPKRHRRPPMSGKTVQLAVPGPGEALEASLFPGKTLRIEQMEYGIYKKTINNEKNLLKKALDCDRIEKIVNLRHPKPSDSIRPVGRGCTKTMKNLWSEAKVPPETRRILLALSDEKGLLWAEGVGADERAAPGKGTRRVLTIELLEG